MAIRTSKDRRKVNESVLTNKRGTKMDRRKCPKCDRLIMNRVKSTRGGTVQFPKCSSCGWIGKKSKQVDANLAEVLLSFDGRIDTAGKKLWMELDPAIMEAAGYKGRRKLHFKAVVVTGKKPKIRWIVE